MDGAHAARTVGRLIRGSKDALASFGKVSARGDTAPRAPRWGDVIGVARGDKRGGVCVISPWTMASGRAVPIGPRVVQPSVLSRVSCSVS